MRLIEQNGMSAQSTNDETDAQDRYPAVAGQETHWVVGDVGAPGVELHAVR